MKRHHAWFVVAALVLAALFVLFKPSPVHEGPQPAVGTAAGAPAPVTADLVVQGGRLVSGPSRIQAREGDTVVLRITADAADELHLHGYDLVAEVGPPGVTQLRFVADRSGRFEFELHRAHAELGALEVLPK